jgi:polyphosphate kinase
MAKSESQRKADRDRKEIVEERRNSEFRHEHFINRELSWLEFNSRVLEEAVDKSTPLLERLKFLTIFSSNLDEFFMVRVAGLREQALQHGAPQDVNADGMPPLRQLQQICKRVDAQVTEQYSCLNKTILPALAKEGIVIADYEDLEDTTHVDNYFERVLFPVITPMAIDPAHPQPRYHNRAIYLMAQLRRRKVLGPKRLFAVVQLPQLMPRLVPTAPPGETNGKGQSFILMENLIKAHLPKLLGGFQVEQTATFRITRDSDVDIIEQESDDMLVLIEERLRAQRRADAVRLEISAEADEALVNEILEQEELRTESSGPANYTELYRINGPLDLTGFTDLLKLPGYPRLHDPPFTPQNTMRTQRPGENFFDAIRRRDVLLHHPFDSFEPVVEFVRQAAHDPNVLAIKQTLYRTSGDSPIVKALIEAAENGKHVTAIVELKARFDEAANVNWARQMESFGVHVVYGFLDLKTHCKMSLVVRRENDSVSRYVHMSTGNYNPTTAKYYTDLGLFTANEDIATDVSALFNLLTGYSQGHKWRKLSIAPENLQSDIIRLIDDQAERARKGKPARIFAKLNSLVDPLTIEALYRASQAGVDTELVIRGICCLRPGVKGISKNIRVYSIVDRFLEHSRLFVFGPDSNAKILLSSADWMPRNFYRRVELMFPVESPALRKRILNEIIPAYSADNVKSRELQADGTYRRIKPKDSQPTYRCQEELLAESAQFQLQTWGEEDRINRRRKRKKQ